jgi:hypothetical protein
MARGSGGDRHHAGREFDFTDLILSKFQPSLLERKSHHFWWPPVPLNYQFD